MGQKAVFTSWGGLRWEPDNSERLLSTEAVTLGESGWLAYGNGRSYGDSCFSAGGTQIDMRGLNRVLSFDDNTGIVECEPGVILGDLINQVATKGWFPAVVPGTRYVTIGGAIANDIHGKNHHRYGTFGEHVLSFDLLRPGSGVMHCSASKNAAEFRATIGGMGLTGLILNVRLQLRRITSPHVIQHVQPLASLGDFFRLAPKAEANHEYCVAWIDSLASGDALGRGVLLAGDHAEAGIDAETPPLASPKLSVPFTPPISPINRWTLTAFNAAYRYATLRNTAPKQVSCSSFFFPLDAVDRWNRLYGPRGLRQHQSILPLGVAEQTIRTMIETTHAAKQGSFLTVLKLFQKRQPAGMMSFPIEGLTLTLDFPHLGARTDALLDQLDRLTIEAQGRVNPYKDAHMSAATFNASFPDRAAFQRMMVAGARSQFSQRVGLT
jgi:FAD/FMN-containing dehydrogenase